MWTPMSIMMMVSIMLRKVQKAIDSTTSLGWTTASPPACHLWKLSSWFCFGFCCCHLPLQQSLVHCLWFSFGLWPSGSDVGTSRLISRASADTAPPLWKVATRTPQRNCWITMFLFSPFNISIIIITNTWSLIGTITHQLSNLGIR